MRLENNGAGRELTTVTIADMPNFLVANFEYENSKDNQEMRDHSFEKKSCSKNNDTSKIRC